MKSALFSFSSPNSTTGRETEGGGGEHNSTELLTGRLCLEVQPFTFSCNNKRKGAPFVCSMNYSAGEHHALLEENDVNQKKKP